MFDALFQQWPVPGEIIRDDSIMFNLKLYTKFLKRLRSVSRSIVSFQSFGRLKYEKQVKRCCITSLIASPVRAVAIITCEKVSTVKEQRTVFQMKKHELDPFARVR